MKSTIAVISVIVAVLSFQSGLFADIIKIKSSTTPVRGTITEITPNGVTVVTGQSSRTIPSNDIVNITYDGAPPILLTIQQNFQNSRYGEVLSLISDGLGPAAGAISANARQELAYYKAYSTAKLAQETGTDIEKAGNELLAFTRDNAKSYHLYKVKDMLGELYLASDMKDKYQRARREYTTLLAEVPWDEYKFKATIALGMIDIEENKLADAKTKFQKIIADVSQNAPETLKRQSSFATLGLARCTAREKKYDEAIAALDKLAAESDPEDKALQSAICLALGETNLAAGRPKDAALNYLQIDILHKNNRIDHIAALKQLAGIWQALQRGDRVREVKATLRSVYGIQM